MSRRFGVIGVMDGWKKGDLPGPQMVSIFLGSYGTLKDGKIVITSELATDKNVDEEVDQLIKGLEAVRKEAKENIRKTNKKIRSSLLRSSSNESN